MIVYAQIKYRILIRVIIQQSLESNTRLYLTLADDFKKAFDSVEKSFGITEWTLTRTLEDLDVATTATHAGEDGGTTEYIHTRVGFKINTGKTRETRMRMANTSTMGVNASN